ncbi:MAG: molybdopterin-dependent oxidoreductase [Chloroflexi bacterium]|nr:molybdopterin-dependent oxidoreductase [Chloroflexota bacterium]
MVASQTSPGQEKVVTTTCSSHCGGTCVLQVHVKDGVITRIESDSGAEPQFRACLKGRAYRQRVYAPDRLKYPMKRVGKRGEGEFERISWDEALDTVAGELKRVKEKYGCGAIFFKGSGGDMGTIHGQIGIDRLLSMFGGYSTNWGYYSHEGGVFAELATYGTLFTRNTRDNLLHSKLIIMWGWNPVHSISDTNATWYLAQAREKGIKIVSVDPRFSDSTAAFAHQWIPIRPGTDAAMLIAMAHVMISEGLHDQAFLEKYTVGFDKFEAYVLGCEDDVPKTPEWAEAICGVPAQTIVQLAREYAATRPAALICGISPGRSAFGEQYHRAAITLTAMTGNTGRKGGDAASRSWAGGTVDAFPFMKLGPGLRGKANPQEKNWPTPRNVLAARQRYYRGKGVASQGRICDALLTGKAGGYPDDYKMLYIVNTNYPNQYLNINRVAKSFQGLEFVVVHEQFMTPAAKFADILLPSTTYMERSDVVTGGATPYYGCMNQAIEPVHESKSHLQIAIELAPRLSISDYLDKTEEDLVKDVVKGSTIPDYGAFRETGSYKLKFAEPHLAFKPFVDDPLKNPLPTPSGKIEIDAKVIAELKDPRVPPIPKYIETWESPRDPLAKKYPLQLVTSHSLARAHSQFHNIPWVRENIPHKAVINAADAAKRGIKDGDMVRVFNDRGSTILPVRVSERIMPGVVDVPQGAWFDPDEKGVDRGGCANVLTRDEPSPVGAFSTNTALVQVEKA